MPAQRLASLFRRYTATHLCLTQTGQPLLDAAGQMVGQIDRLRLQGGRLMVEGWAAAPAITLALGPARADSAPTLPRADVARAHPRLGQMTPGFMLELPFAHGPATLSLGFPDQRLIYQLTLPAPRRLARARLRLVPAFLRDLGRATPTLGEETSEAVPATGERGGL